MPPSIFIRFFGLFTGRFKLWAWGVVILMIFAAAFWWVSSDNSRLKKENAQIALKIENNHLKATVEVQEAERRDLMNKMERMADSITRLNEAYSRNAIQRQRNFEAMTGPIERDQQGRIATKPLEEKANQGMNGLFDELENFSQKEALK